MFKAGDRVRCKPGYTTSEDSGGMGYVEGKEFIIGYITNPYENPILWVDNVTNGVYAEACEIVHNQVWTGSSLKFNFVI
jgi:hypothetical protein